MLGLVKPAMSVANVPTSDEAVDLALWTWERSRAIGDLADLLAFGLDIKQHVRLTPAAQAALSSPDATPAMKLVAQEILTSGASEFQVWRESQAAKSVRGLRALLRNTPSDVIALVDLAQHHLAVGKQRAANRALMAAHQISPDSVHVIRAVTRFWIHVGMPEKAHAFIKKAPRTAADPWLMASEIATAQVAGAQSTQLRKAQRALSTKSFKSRDVTELAGAVGGAELYQGNFKEARKLFRLALEYPTDNVLAQAITNQDHLQIEISQSLIEKAPNGVFEGRALQALLRTDFEAVDRLTECWAEEEAFSSRPRLLQSFVHGALGNFKEALEAADTGLLTDPKDMSLRGNRAYALALMKRFDEAEAELELIDSQGNEDNRPLTLATMGAVQLLRGNHGLGSDLYEEALTEFERQKAEQQYSDCLAFFARTAMQAESPKSSEVLQRAAERFLKVPSHAAAVVLRTLNQKAEVEDKEPMRRVTQWEWNKTANVLTEKRGLTRKGAPTVVMLPNQTKDK
jgi:tetratricopeptide (TPR) repeat protein